MQNAPIPGDEELGRLPGGAALPEAPPGAPGDPVAPVEPVDPASPVADPVAAPGAPPGPPQAGRGTTIALVAALAMVVVMSGVLGAVAVVMTRNPDAPPLSTTQVRRLQTPMHLAPVTGVRPAPCPDTDGVPDDKNTTCYQLDPGVNVTTVQKVEALPERDGTYSVRVVLAPSSQEQVTKLTHDTVQQQLAIVVGDKVVAAPRVAQEITQDSLSIAGFTKEQADDLVALLVGTAAPQSGPSQPPATQPGTTQPGTTQPATTQPGTAQPGTTQPGTTQGQQQATQQPVRTPPGVTQPESLTTTGASSRNGQAARSQGWRSGNTMRFPDCKAANAAGYGPYTKGVHPEYYWYKDVDNDGVACDPDDL
ncbi:hypothetical protein MPTA5024_10500 [Microbispora sp. ATCC PTA-5024]|nr:hypothetical protein MPTA5024_10500 [Microbispora sp. ATCC PTA-5024]